LLINRLCLNPNLQGVMMLRELICQAISERRLIRFDYKGEERIVEPHLLGERTSGNEALSAWQVGGFSESNSQPPWRSYLLDKMAQLVILEQQFDGPRPGYNPHDSTMSRIFCRLEGADNLSTASAQMA
jgi:hypothetical protein